MFILPVYTENHISAAHQLDYFTRSENCCIITEGEGRRRLEVVVKADSVDGTKFGLTFSHMGAGAEPETLAFSYNMKVLRSDWNKPHGKLPGFGGTYHKGGWGKRRGYGHDGWSARMYITKGDEDGYEIGFYVYHICPLMKNHFKWVRLDGSPYRLARDHWTNIRTLCVLNSMDEHTLSDAYDYCSCIPQDSWAVRADGVLQGWIEEEPVAYLNEETGTLHPRLDFLWFRSIPTVKIDSFWFDVYLGQKGDEHPEQKIRFDRIKFPFFSTERILNPLG